ncbi:MAG: DUF4097 family beta strand repeat protein [Clostridia bacterium]|nr:DUF4097 family beta strand repeat protein [Clostridia bacterium]
MEKYFLIALVILSLVALAGCASQSVVMNDTKTYDITKDICSLDIDINAADFVIEQGEEFSVESNLKNLSVSEEDGVLKIVEKTKFARNYNSAFLRLCIPDDMTFENASIKTGASKLTAESFSANALELKTGAGRVEFEYLEASENVNIKGGAGEIFVKDGNLNNLTLDLGVGELNMTAKLLGESELKFGVGESDLTLIGSRDDYNLDITSGVGKITVDDANSAFFANSTNGESHVRIKGGVGSTNITFQE